MTEMHRLPGILPGEDTRQVALPDKETAAFSPLLRKKKPAVAAVLFGIAAVVCVVLLNLLFDRVFLPLSSIPAPSRLEDGGGRNEWLASCGASRLVSLRCKGSDPVAVTSDAKSVGELLESIGVTFDGDDLLNVPAGTALSDGMEIVLDEVSYQTVSIDEETPFETVYREVDSIPRGSVRTVSEGVPGVVRRTYSVRSVNGNSSSRELISESVVTEPVSAIAEKGVGGVYTAADGKTYTYSHYMDVTATAYGKNDGASGDWTYTGARATWGVIAVDPTVIPLHTKVYVVGDYGDYGVNYAEDIGGGIKGRHIDICMDCSLEEMLRFGFRNMRVYFID